MGHPYIDLIDVMLEVGLPQVQEMSFFKEFCVKGKFNQDIDLYNKLYDLQTKKKLTELLTAYVKEVYLYNSCPFFVFSCGYFPREKPSHLHNMKRLTRYLDLPLCRIL